MLLCRGTQFLRLDRNVDSDMSIIVTWVTNKLKNLIILFVSICIVADERIVKVKKLLRDERLIEDFGVSDRSCYCKNSWSNASFNRQSQVNIFQSIMQYCSTPTQILSNASKKVPTLMMMKLRHDENDERKSMISCDLSSCLANRSPGSDWMISSTITIFHWRWWWDETRNSCRGRSFERSLLGVPWQIIRDSRWTFFYVSLTHKSQSIAEFIANS